MTKFSRVSPLVPLVVLAVGLLSSACESTSTGSAPTASPAAPVQPSTASAALAASELTLVTDPSQVCMVNNQFMGRPQIPVRVNGKTYYGCCAMCKARLEGDVTARTAVDPVTQASVDKATAVIGATSTGAALYFASREHFDAYARRPRLH